MAIVYLALGTNLGDRFANLRAAIAALSEIGRVHALSRVYETAPLYVTDQPAFLNMAARAETDLPPHALLGRLKALEEQLGRVAGRRYGPRLIDLDILLYESDIVASETLEIPHPRLPERRFALAPLADIAAELRHPTLGATVAALLAALPAADDIRVAADHLN